MDLVNWASIRLERSEYRVETISTSKFTHIPSNSPKISLIERVIAFIKDFFVAKKQEPQAGSVGSFRPKPSESQIAPAQVSEGSQKISGTIYDLEKEINNTENPLTGQKLKTGLRTLVAKLEKTSSDERKNFAKNTFADRIAPLRNNSLLSGSISADFFVHIDDLFRKIEEQNQHEINEEEQFSIDRGRLRNPIFGKDVSVDEAKERVKTELDRLFPPLQQSPAGVNSETLLKRTLKILSQHSLNLIPILWGSSDRVAVDPSSITMRLDSEKKIIEIKSYYTISKLDPEDLPQSHERLNVIMYIPLDPKQIGQFIITRVANHPTSLTNKFSNFFMHSATG